MKKVALALLVLLTVTSVSFAGGTLPVTWVDNTPAQGEYSVVYSMVTDVDPAYETYTIGISTTVAGGFTSVSDIAVTGNAVQLSLYDDMEEVWNGTPGPISSTVTPYKYDTHILDLSSYSGAGAGVLIVGSGWTEDNDMSLTTPSTTATRAYGIGNLYLKNDSTTISVKSPITGLSEMNFIQVCVPAGQSATITGKFTSIERSEASLPMIPFTIMINEVPEPSTIVMLVLGALCLVGARLRRK